MVQGRLFSEEKTGERTMSGYDRERHHVERRHVLTSAGALLAAGAALPAATAPKSATDDGGALQTMRAWQVGDQQGIASLTSVARSVPQPGPGEVLIDVKSSALNHRDLGILSGRYGPPKPAQRIPIGDGAGIIVAAGAGVTAWKVGDRVTAPHFTLWADGDYDPAIFTADAGNTRDGWLAERIVLPAASLAGVPESMSFEEAAALGAAGITAWAVLQSFARIKAGDIVLTLGTGGVSVLALQIAKLFGARVAITSSSDDKLATCRRLGADITVNYRREPDWPAAIRAATAGRGVDIVVDTVGPSTLSQSLACCAPNARVGLLGALGGAATKPPNLGLLILNNIVLKGITSGSRRMLEDLLRASTANRLRPHIDRTFAFNDAAKALAYLEGGEHVGKVVISRA